jgi:hypothetical protein
MPVTVPRRPSRRDGPQIPEKFENRIALQNLELGGSLILDGGFHFFRRVHPSETGGFMIFQASLEYPDRRKNVQPLMRNFVDQFPDFRASLLAPVLHAGSGNVDGGRLELALPFHDEIPDAPARGVDDLFPPFEYAGVLRTDSGFIRLFQIPEIKSRFHLFHRENLVGEWRMPEEDEYKPMSQQSGNKQCNGS